MSKNESEINLKMLASKLKMASSSTEQQLASRLRSLAVDVARASQALSEGKPLDENLITNASGIANLITRWNMLLEHLPYTEV